MPTSISVGPTLVFETVEHTYADYAIVITSYRALRPNCPDMTILTTDGEHNIKQRLQRSSRYTQRRCHFRDELPDRQAVFIRIDRGRHVHSGHIRRSMCASTGRQRRRLPNNDARKFDYRDPAKPIIPHNFH